MLLILLLDSLMALINCPECENRISEHASACPQCGNPIASSEEDKSASKGAWRAVIKSKTPINIFALAMMASASIFGMSATQLGEDSLTGFTYSLHIFLAIAGMFFVCLIFCPRVIYHPEDLVKAKKGGVDLGTSRPLTAAILISLMILLYGVFQLILFLKSGT